MEPKPVYSSHLALRFYFSDGWTKDEVDSLLERGTCTCIRDALDIDCCYYCVSRASGRIDVDKVLAACSELYRYPNCHMDCSDRQYLEEFQ